MPERISVGGLDLSFLETMESGDGSLTLFEMTVQPNARMPIAHHHRNWDETVYGLAGVSIWRVDGQDRLLQPGETIFIGRGVVHALRKRHPVTSDLSSHTHARRARAPPISARWQRSLRPALLIPPRRRALC